MDIQYKCQHDRSIDELFSQYKKCKDAKDKIISFFLASFSSGNLLWRSFLPAYAIVRTYPKHYYDGVLHEDPFEDKRCSICSGTSYAGIKEEYYEFYLGEAQRFGGIGVYSGIEECIVLLTEFNKLADITIKLIEADLNIFFAIMDCLVNAELTDSLKIDIVRKIKNIKSFKTNKYQTKSILQTLGFCGILETTEHKSSFHKYINLGLAPKKSHESEWEYPVDFWTPVDGINQEAFKFWFGDYPQLDKFWK